MELSANNVGIQIVKIGQCKLKDNIVELLILVQNWRQLGFFLIHIYVKEYPWKRKYRHKLTMVCLFWILISFSCQYYWFFPFIDCINGNLTSLHFLLSNYSPSRLWGVGPKTVWFQVIPNIFFSDIICHVFLLLR